MNKEISFFKGLNLWKNGYLEGDPLDPAAVPNSFIHKTQHLGFAKTNGKPYLNVVYQECIKPYITPETMALEIGPGGGTWTKCMLSAKEIHTLDVLEKTPNFSKNVEKYEHKIKYHVVNDFSCSELPNNYFDYMFSFGSICHISFDGITEYAKNLFNKLKPEANCFWMISDEKKFSKDTGVKTSFPSNFNNHMVGFYKQNIPETCNMLKQIGYQIISEDLDIILRDPIIHFKKPKIASI